MKLSQCIMFTVSIARNETHVDIVINYLCVCFLLFLTGNAVDLYINTMGLGIEYLLQLTCARIILNYFKQMTGAQYNIVQKFCTFYYEWLSLRGRVYRVHTAHEINSSLCYCIMTEIRHNDTTQPGLY